MHFILLKVEFKNGYLDEVLGKISVYESGSQLVTLRLFNRLSKLVINLI